MKLKLIHTNIHAYVKATKRKKKLKLVHIYLVISLTNKLKFKYNIENKSEN